MRFLTEHPMEMSIQLISFKNKPINESIQLPVVLLGLSSEFALFCSDLRLSPGKDHLYRLQAVLLEETIQLPALIRSRKILPNGLCEYQAAFEFESQDQFMKLFQLPGELDKYIKDHPHYSNFRSMVVWEMWNKRQHQSSVS